MTKQINYLESKIFDFFLSNNSKKNIEKYVLVISIVGFIFHLLLIYLNKFEIIKINDPYNLLNNPISAVYTPFSFILVYEIYLLIYYLPRSISTYISKQFEIITLIVIRRIFKKISDIDFEKELIFNSFSLDIFIDLGAALILFFLIYLFRRNSIKSEKNSDEESFKIFIRIKKWTSSLLIPILSVLALTNFIKWLIISYLNPIESSSINSIFFDEFFQILILVDVLLLIISALLFGLMILIIYNECEKRKLFRN